MTPLLRNNLSPIIPKGGRVTLVNFLGARILEKNTLNRPGFKLVTPRIKGVNITRTTKNMGRESVYSMGNMQQMSQLMLSHSILL